MEQTLLDRVIGLEKMAEEQLKMLTEISQAQDNLSDQLEESTQRFEDAARDMIGSGAGDD